MRKKIFVLLLSLTLIVFSIVMFNKYFDNFMNQNNIHLNNEMLTEHNEGEIHSNIKTFENIKRILVDTQINTWTANDQQYPQVSTLSDGNFVVVWQSYLQDGNGYGIYGQIFYSNGAKKGNEFPICDYTIWNQTSPNVAASLNGKFMVYHK